MRVASPAPSRADHLLGHDPGVELLGGDVARARAPPRAACVPLWCAFFAILRRLVVADVRVERGHQHQRALHAARRCASRSGSMPRAQCSSKLRTPSAEQPHALQEVVDDQRLEDVELEVARRAADVDRDVVADHLAHSIVSASHCVGLTLPGMIELPGSFSGMRDLAEPAARPARRASARRWRSSSATRRASSARRARCTSASCAASASNLFGAVTNGRPVSSRELGRDARRRTPGGAFRPVPTAVPPSASSHRCGSAAAHVRDAVVELRDPAARSPGRASAASRPAGACGRS